MKGGVVTIAARLAITIGLLLVLVFVVAEPAELFDTIANVSPGAMLAAVLLSAVDRFVMAYKWSLLLRSRHLAVSLWTAVRSYFASSLVGLVLPVTVGADAVRVLALRHVGMIEVTASIVVERALGAIAMASVGLVSCLLLTTAMTDVAVGSLAVWLLIAIAIAVTLFVVSLRVADRWAVGRSQASRLRKAAEAYGQYRRHPVLLSLFYGLSVGESLISVLIAYVVARGLGLAVPLHLLIATVPIALASARLPISLGGFGVQEASFVYLAGLVGIASTDALSIMLLSDVAMLITLLPSAFDSSMLGLSRQVPADRAP